MLSGSGLLMLYLAGRKVWWAWLIGLVSEVMWFSYSITTKQYGFIVGSVPYTWVYARNAWHWRRDGAR
jgi:nicotinamide riboside transporter PnuC